jgi:hypothetical protein
MGSYQFVGFAGLARPLIRWTGLEYGVAWTAYPGIGFVRLSPAGAPIGSAVQISNDGGQLTGLQWTGAAYGAASWQWFSASLWDIAFTRIGCNCTDADLDGVTNCEDCDDASASAWRPPNEVTGVRFAANKQQISWDPPDDPGSAAGTIRYDTLRSPSAADFQNPGVCLEPNGSDTSSVDPAIPLAGSVWFYLVRAEGGCTAGGLLGLTSAGTERTAGSCP